MDNELREGCWRVGGGGGIKEKIGKTNSIINKKYSKENLYKYKNYVSFNTVIIILY